MASRTAYSTWTPQEPTLFDGHYLRNRSTLDIGVLGYIGIVQHKEYSPEVLSIPPGTPCIQVYVVSRVIILCIFDHFQPLIQSAFSRSPYEHPMKVPVPKTLYCFRFCVEDIIVCHAKSTQRLQRDPALSGKRRVSFAGEWVRLYNISESTGSGNIFGIKS